MKFRYTGKKDASGHTVYGDIGVFLRDSLNAYLKPKGGRTFYIDPSYIIRSVPPTPNEDTPAQRTLLAPEVATATGRCSQSMSSLRGSAWMLGGARPWCTQSAALTNPAAPATVLVWPTLPLIEPTTSFSARRKRCWRRSCVLACRAT